MIFFWLRARDKDKVLSPKRIEPQTFQFRASRIYRWATETLRRARPLLDRFYSHYPRLLNNLLKWFKKVTRLSALERKDLTWTGSCILKTGFNSGRIRSTYSCDVQSSAISNTLGRANGTIWWLLNSEHNCGKTLCITTRWWWNTKNGNQVQPSTHNVNPFNPQHPNISMYILPTVLYTFLKVLSRRIFLTMKSFFSW